MTLKNIALQVAVALAGLGLISWYVATTALPYPLSAQSHSNSAPLALESGTLTCDSSPLEKDYKAVLEATSDTKEVFVVGCGGVF